MEVKEFKEAVKSRDLKRIISQFKDYVSKWPWMTGATADQLDFVIQVTHLALTNHPVTLYNVYQKVIARTDNEIVKQLIHQQSSCILYNIQEYHLALSHLNMAREYRVSEWNLFQTEKCTIAINKKYFTYSF